MVFIADNYYFKRQVYSFRIIEWSTLKRTDPLVTSSICLVQMVFTYVTSPLPLEQNWTNSWLNSGKLQPLPRRDTYYKKPISSLRQDEEPELRDIRRLRQMILQTDNQKSRMINCDLNSWSCTNYVLCDCIGRRGGEKKQKKQLPPMKNVTSHVTSCDIMRHLVTRMFLPIRMNKYFSTLIIFVLILTLIYKRDATNLFASKKG